MRLLQPVVTPIELNNDVYSNDTYLIRYKTLLANQKEQLNVITLRGFFIKKGNSDRLIPSFRKISTILFLGLTDQATVDLSDPKDSTALPPMTNQFKFYVTNHLQTNKALMELKLGLVIKYTKLSKRVRKNLRGKQRYKAYLVLLNDMKTQGNIIRLYRLLSLTLSETRDYERYSDLSLFYTELFFFKLSYDMIYTQVQKLMIQSYVDNGGRAVVPNVLEGV